ncbi:hypothetical protein ACH4E8_08050 [Streptomyces sp. NPDC017979]|uniref:hypothetical protein n=1 Tax=Streptomyces sp. NPDC017979 TaxID=3365024 RepID=UPI0037AE6C49
MRTLAALGVTLTLGGVLAAGLTAAPSPPSTTGPDTAEAAVSQVTGTGTLGAHARPGGPVTREQVIKRAQAWVDQEVMYSQSKWWTHPTTGGPYRQDCSGFVSMAWQLPTSETTHTLPGRAHRIDKKDLKPGDLLNSTQHALLFGAWVDSAKGTFTYYQESRPGRPAHKATGSIHEARLAGHPTSSYTALRYKNVVDAAPPAAVPPKPAPKPKPKPIPKTTPKTTAPAPAPAPSAQSRTLRLSTIVTAQNGLYARSADGRGVYQWSERGKKWTKVWGRTKQLYGGGAGLFATDAKSGDIHRYDPEARSWSMIGGPGKTFVMDGQRLYGLSPDGSGIYQWTNRPRQWTRIWDDAHAIHGGPAGLLAVHPRTKNVYRYLPGSGSWALTGGPGKTFTTDAKHLYGLSPDGSGVYQWTGRAATWTKVGGPAGTLYGGAAGLFATNPDTGQLYRYDSARRTWHLTGGPGRTFTVGDKHLYRLSPDGTTVHRWTNNGTHWTRLGAPGSP